MIIKPRFSSFKLQTLVWVIELRFHYTFYREGASSVMVARGALWNASIFSPEGKLPWEEVKREYIRKVLLPDNYISMNVFFTIIPEPHFMCSCF